MILTSKQLGVLAVLCLPLAGWSCAPAIAAQSASGCRPADTHTVPPHLAYFKARMSGTDSSALAFRSAIGLQLVSANKVTLVTKTTTCASAATAVNTLQNTPGMSRQVWVYSLGSDYAVEDPTIPVPPQGEGSMFFFSGTWTLKTVLGM
jgi:hypothetical protein